MRLTVWGTGAWGLALADRIARPAHEVLVYTRRLAGTCAQAAADDPWSARVGVAWTDDLALAAESDGWLLATPTRYLEALALRLRSHVRRGVAVLSCAKGLTAESGERPTEVLCRVWAGREQPAMHTLGGPNLAHEVAAGLPAAAVLAGPGSGAGVWQEALGDSLHLAATDDVAGVEYGGALKNVVVIATACTRSLYGENAAAAVAHGGFGDMRRLACAAGARDETVLGLAGFGDLLATHASDRSRNRRCGEAIARGVALDAWLDARGSVVEGVDSAYGADRLARRLRVDAPVLQAALALVRGAEPGCAIRDLLSPHRLPPRSATPSAVP